MKIGHGPHRQPVHVVTQARRPMSEDIANRQRRYLYMMGFRVACFGIAVVMFLYHFGWWSLLPAVFAIAIPYFAVVYANSGREPDNVRGFLEYRMNLPARRAADGQDNQSQQDTNSQGGFSGNGGHASGGDQGGEEGHGEDRPGSGY